MKKQNTIIWVKENKKIPPPNQMRVISNKFNSIILQ